MSQQSNLVVVQNTNTIIGIVNQLSGFMDSQFVPRLDTTINAKRNVLASQVPATKPTIKYFGIGTRGYYNVDDDTLSSPYKPSAKNLDLHRPIPLRVVPVGEDLPLVERDKYRMRTKETIDGEDYYLYWLKVLNFSAAPVDITSVDPDTLDTTDYVFDPSDLYPTPVKGTGTDTVDSVTSKVIVSSTGESLITGEEISEAINIIYGGDLRMARISEWGFYSGVESEISVVDNDTDPGTSDPITLKEVAYCQLSTHRCTTGVDMSDPTSTASQTISIENGTVSLI